MAVKEGVQRCGGLHPSGMQRGGVKDAAEGVGAEAAKQIDGAETA